MTTYNPFGYNFITVPRFDVQFMFSNNSSFMLRDKYMKYFAYLCLIGGVRLLYSIIKASYQIMRKYYYQLRGVQKKTDACCVILGFGDSDASLQIAIYFANLGYNLILVNNNFMINSRSKNIDEIRNLEHISVDIFSTETISNVSFETLESRLSNKNMKISHIFDATILRIKQNSEEFTSSEITFNMNKIKEYINSYSLFFDFMKKFSSETKVYALNYTDKQSDADHRLFASFRNVMYQTFSYIFSNKYIFKNVNLYSEKKKKEFTDKDIAVLYKNSENNFLSEFNFTN